MSTRSGQTYTRSNVQPSVQKNTSRTIIKPSVEETEEETEEEKQQRLVAKVGNNDCSICYDKLDNKDFLTELYCGDIFHKNCINQLMNYNSTSSDICPNCRREIPISKIPENNRAHALENRENRKREETRQEALRLEATNPQDYQNYEEEEDEEEYEEEEEILSNNELNLRNIITSEMNLERAVPFFGVVLCNNQQMIIRYLNATNFNLGTANTLGQLKNAIFSKEPEILQSIPQGIFCAARNIASMFTSRIQPVTRRIQIGPMNFTTPSTCAIDGLITPTNYTDATILTTVYLDYLNAAQTFLSSAERRSLNYNLVKDVYSLYHPPSDQPAYLNDFNPYQPDSYYRNLENPTIPDNFRAESSATELDSHGTYAPIAWLAFQIECINSGGKSRKSRKCKKSKKCKKSRKSKK